MILMKIETPEHSLISVIMPVYNGTLYINEAIHSVLEQTYQNWELLIINDGSTDNSKDKINAFQDPRIQYFEQANKGVSSARNVGLKNMQGEYFSFLDADDVLPTNSLSSRYNIFTKNPDLSFVDGVVQYTDEFLIPLEKLYKPEFYGEPFNRLIALDSNCYFGNTWMIKREETCIYHFETAATHAEDLLFYLSISKGKIYHYTDECVLHYRQRKDSAMKKIKGLENGYFQFSKLVKKEAYLSEKELLGLNNRIKLILFKSYIRTLNLFSAFRVLLHKL